MTHTTIGLHIYMYFVFEEEMAFLLTPRDTTDATVNRWKFNRRAAWWRGKEKKNARKNSEGEGGRSKAEDRMGCITSTPAVAPIEVVVRVHESEFSCTYCSPDGRSAWGIVFGRCCTDHQSARFFSTPLLYHHRRHTRSRASLRRGEQVRRLYEVSNWI